MLNIKKRYEDPEIENSELPIRPWLKRLLNIQLWFLSWGLSDSQHVWDLSKRDRVKLAS